MAITIGVNSGFCAVSPIDDPAGATWVIDARAFVIKDTSPSGINVITEVGWWCDTVSEEANFEVGLYAADGAVVPGEAGTLLQVSRTNAKGTTAGWKKVIGLNWSIDASTPYWIGVQVDNVTTETSLNATTTGGAGFDSKTIQTTLTDPFGGGALQEAAGKATIYAVYGAAGGSVGGGARYMRWNPLGFNVFRP